MPARQPKNTEISVLENKRVNVSIQYKTIESVDKRQRSSVWDKWFFWFTLVLVYFVKWSLSIVVKHNRKWSHFIKNWIVRQTMFVFIQMNWCLLFAGEWTIFLVFALKLNMKWLHNKNWIHFIKNWIVKQAMVVFTANESVFALCGVGWMNNFISMCSSDIT